jgi:hypothetical protein
MDVKKFTEQLHSHPQSQLALRFPNGQLVPAHFHITELGHVTKRFVDCGGTRRVQEACLLQVWVHDDVEHRLTAHKLSGIFAAAADLELDACLPVEFECELETVAVFAVGGVEMSCGVLEVQLEAKHTDCLARGVCLPGSCDGEAGDARATSSLPTVFSAPVCVPGGGCC